MFRRCCNPSAGRAGAILFLADPERAPALDAGVLEQVWGLTPAEARLAKALMQGKTVQDFARDGGVSLNTARTHLKRIFLKTGVRRQAELVRLLKGLMAPLTPA